MGDSFEKNYPLDQFPDAFHIQKAGSSMDCTGLIPSAIQNEDELESYEDLYQFQPCTLCKREYSSEQ